MAQVNLFISKPRPVVLPAVFEWSKINGRTIRGKQLHPGQVLRPGANKIDSEYWKKVKPKAKHYLDDKTILENVSADQAPEDQDPDRLIKFQSLKQAKAAIAEETDIDRLGKWAANDERPEVREAVLERAKQLQGQQEQPSAE